MNAILIRTAVALSILANAVLTAIPARATDAAEQEKRPIVTLVTGHVTLESVLGLLREQTHADIRAEECLRDRIVMVSFDHVSLENVLVALAELNNWQVTSDAPGQYRLARKRAPVNVDIAHLQQAMRNALPLDLQSYAGYRDHASIGSALNPRLPGIPGNPALLDPSQLRDKQISTMQSILFADIVKNSAGKKQLSYTELSAEQKTMLAHIILLGLSKHVWADPLMVNPIPPNLLDPRQTAVFVQDHRLNHGYALKVGSKFAFLGDGGEVVDP
jgi:hypothetical protein